MNSNSLAFEIHEFMEFQVYRHLKQKSKIEKIHLCRHLKQEFHQFLEHDLKGLAVQSLEEETIKTTERLASLISRTELNMKRKSERLKELSRP